jgi:hypothetical protein
MYKSVKKLYSMEQKNKTQQKAQCEKTIFEIVLFIACYLWSWFLLWNLCYSPLLFDIQARVNIYSSFCISSVSGECDLLIYFFDNVGGFFIVYFVSMFFGFPADLHDALTKPLAFTCDFKSTFTSVNCTSALILPPCEQAPTHREVL